MGAMDCVVAKGAGARATGLKARQENRPLTSNPAPVPTKSALRVATSAWHSHLPAVAPLAQLNERSECERVPPVVPAPVSARCVYGELMDSASDCDGDGDAAGVHVYSAVESLSSSASVDCSLLHADAEADADAPIAMREMSPPRADSGNARQSTPMHFISTPVVQFAAPDSTGSGDHCVPQRSASTPSSQSPSPTAQPPLLRLFDSNSNLDSPSAALKDMASRSGNETCSARNNSRDQSQDDTCSASEIVDLTSGSEEDYSVEAPRLAQQLAHAGDSVVGLNLEAARNQIEHFGQPIAYNQRAPQLLQMSITQYGTAMKNLTDRRSFVKCSSRSSFTEELSFQMQQHLSISTGTLEANPVHKGTKRSNASRGKASKPKKSSKRPFLERCKDQPQITEWFASSSIHLRLPSIVSPFTGSSCFSDSETSAIQDASRAAAMSTCHEGATTSIPVRQVMPTSSLFSPGPGPTLSHEPLNCIVPSIHEVITTPPSSVKETMNMTMSNLLAAPSPNLPLLSSPNREDAAGDAADGQFDMNAGGFMLDCEKTCAPIQPGRHSLHGTTYVNRNANMSVGRADTPEYSTPGHSPRCLAVRRLQVPFTPPARKTRHDPRYEAQSYRAKGTPYYMAPEVWRAGEHLATSDDQSSGSGREKLSTASDMWSLGCMLLEILTMYQPFSSSRSGSEPIKQNVLAFADPVNPDDSCTHLVFHNCYAHTPLLYIFTIRTVVLCSLQWNSVHIL